MMGMMRHDLARTASRVLGRYCANNTRRLLLLPKTSKPGVVIGKHRGIGSKSASSLLFSTSTTTSSSSSSSTSNSTGNSNNDLLITNARIWAEDTTDFPRRNITVCGKSGKIKEVSPIDSEKSTCGVVEGLQVIDADDGLVTPPYAEPHLHLDAVLLGKKWQNQSGTLVEGIANWALAKGGLSADDVLQRARVAIKWMVACGTTRIRTHADTGCPVGVEALLSLRESIKKENLATIQVVGFPQDGILTAPGHEADLIWAVEGGVDAVGGIPHLERTYEEASASMRLVFDLAEKHGVMVDVHCDETDDPTSRHLETVCALTEDRGMGGAVIAGHCTAMHSYSGPAANKAISAVLRSGVQVVTNPLDSIVLQGRFDDYPKRRGLTRVPELLEAGTKVGLGHDSVIDPWYPLGVGNIMDAAFMLVHACHLTGQAQMRRVFQMLVSDNHIPFGGAPEIKEGEKANFLVHSLGDPVDILRMRRMPSFVIRDGEIVASNSHPKATVCGEEIDVGNMPTRVE